MKKNIQKQLENFWHHACYALCISYVNTDQEVRENIYYHIMNVIAGWNNGYIEDDCYVAKPHKYASMCVGDEKTYKDVEKVPLAKLEDLPEDGEWIVEWKCPSGGSHFTVETRQTILTDEPLFDPSYLSNSRKAKQAISYRKYIKYKE